MMKDDRMYQQLCHSKFTDPFNITAVNINLLVKLVCAPNPEQTYINIIKWLPVDQWVEEHVCLNINN